MVRMNVVPPRISSLVLERTATSTFYDTLGKALTNIPWHWALGPGLCNHPT